jgi:hypothetical protein
MARYGKGMGGKGIRRGIAEVEKSRSRELVVNKRPYSMSPLAWDIHYQ